jgi:hypothetical protein
VICSKSPNPYVYRCIERLYTLQIRNDTENNYKVVIVDSDSDDFTNYDRIKNDFPEVDIHLAKNKNYEYGAWKYAFSLYPDDDIYFCIQDTLIMHHTLDLSVINDTNAYTYHVDCGFDLELRDTSTELLADCELNWKPFMGRNFILATHSSFIVTRPTMHDIFQTLTKPPVNKFGCCSYERIFGVYFILKGKKTIDMSGSLKKIHGNRL